jgi:hypothetical protein
VILPEPRDATYAIIGGTILSVLLMLISVLALRASPDKPRAAPRRTVTICSGCGSEWSLVSSIDGLFHRRLTMKPISTCPNCPLSMDEFERLKKEMRERKAGGGE